MRIEKLQKNFGLMLRNLSQIFIWIAFFSICLSYLGFYNFQTSASPDSVYCPLQKIWVKKFEPKTEIKYQPFDEICATSARKNIWQLEISLKTTQPITEKIVFDYLEKGNKIFAKLNSPDLPQRSLIKQSATETAANNFFQDFGKYDFAHFTLPQAARPPTFSTISFRFAFQFTKDLKKISRNINPRSPPIFA